jgi:NO-binding membrane sensor protein with MHYT domain
LACNRFRRNRRRYLVHAFRCHVGVHDAWIDVQYDLVLPILVTGIEFFVVNRADAGLKALGLSGLLMGIGIVAMHYTSMGPWFARGA